MTDEIMLSSDRFIRRNEDGVEFRNLPDGLGQFVPVSASSPTLSRHLATKAYVDSAVLNLSSDIIVTVATIANVDIDTNLEPGDMLDGIILFTGDYVLVKDQLTETENGIYIINAGLGESTKRPTRISNNLLEHETLVFVELGTVNEGKTFALSQPNGGFTGCSGHPNYDVDTIHFTEVVANLPRNINDFIDIKDSVRVASTGSNISRHCPGTTIDNIILNYGDRILLKDQDNQTHNGIYVYNGADVEMIRSEDADENGEIESGMYIFVREGDFNAHTGWVLTTPNPINIDSTDLVFTTFNGVALPTNINTINKLTPSVSNLIIGNGTDWTARKLDLNDINVVNVSNPQTGQVLIYNGTNWVSDDGLLPIYNGSISKTFGTTTLTSSQTPSASSGTQIWSRTISTKSSTRKVELNMSAIIDASVNNRYVTIILLRDSTVIGVYAQTISNHASPNLITIAHVDNITSDGTYTYSARIAVSSGSWYIGRDSDGNTYSNNIGSSYSIKEFK